MTALSGPALLRAAADRLNEMGQAADPGPWEGFETHGRDVCDEAWSEMGVKAGGLRVAETFEGPNYSQRWQENIDLIVTLRGIAPDLAGWLTAFSHEAETLGWVAADGTFKLGSPTRYATEIAKKVLGDRAREGQ